MKKAGIAVLVVVVLGAGWYFVSPLLISKTVNEAFPDLSNVGSVAQFPIQQQENQIPDNIENFTQNTSNLDESEQPISNEDFIPEIEPIPPSTSPSIEDFTPPQVEPTEPVPFRQGMFQGTDSFHKGSGTASIYLSETGNHVLRLEDFSVTNGPDLRVYLSAHPNPESSDDLLEDYIELGTLKGNKGNQNYVIPAGRFVGDYQSVVVYCKPFKVLFATASLGQ